MASPNPFPESGIAPEAPIEQAAKWLASTTVECVLGLLIGIFLARALRGRHLHWSWAATSFVPLLLAPSGFGGQSCTLAVAGLSAVAWGRHWHRQDLDAGADIAKVAARRRSAVDLLRRLWREAELRRWETTGPKAWLRGQELILGIDASRRPISVPLGGGAGGRHTLVVGATGSGKTITQTWLAARAIERGMGAIVVDPKGDGAMREELRAAAMAAGRQYVEWTPDGPSVYNPYARGGETEIADKALAGERFSEPHYQRQAQRYLGHAVRALRHDGSEVSLRSVVEHLDPDRLETLARRLPESDAVVTHAYLDSLTARQRSDLAGVRDRLAILTESDVGPWLDPQTPCAMRLDLLEAVRARTVVYFNLESDRRPLLTQILGAAIVQDLLTAAAALQGRPVPTLVVIDEFSAVAAEQVVRLFGRARSAGLNLLLGTQELSDLRLPGRHGMLEQVMGNLSVLIAHRQVVPGSADMITSVAGTRGSWRVARHSDGRTTRTRMREPVLDPGEVMNLHPGWAAVIVLGGENRVRVGRILSPALTR